MIRVHIINNDIFNANGALQSTYLLFLYLGCLIYASLIIPWVMFWAVVSAVIIKEAK
jgi:hypothetical protein